MTIYFDMDGTITDLYGVEGWLNMLQKEEVYPYMAAAPLVDLQRLNKILRKLQAEGYKIGIISWLARNAPQSYNQAVRQAKKTWLSQKISIKLDEVHIVKYGTPKNKVCKDKNGILFDDEAKNRIQWKGEAYNEKNLLEKLERLLIS